jgi:hypothetical protein
MQKSIRILYACDAAIISDKIFIWFRLIWATMAVNSSRWEAAREEGIKRLSFFKDLTSLKMVRYLAPKFVGRLACGHVGKVGG